MSIVRDAGQTAGGALARRARHVQHRRAAPPLTRVLRTVVGHFNDASLVVVHATTCKEEKRLALLSSQEGRVARRNVTREKNAERGISMR